MFTLFQNDFMPHGFCIKWSWDLLTWYVVSDGFIFLSYSYIGIALILFARKHIGLAWNRLLWLFSFFVRACGITHLMDIVTFWQPMYWLDAILKSVTAVLSFITAIYLAPKIPELMNLHSNDEVDDLMYKLLTEKNERRKAELLKENYLEDYFALNNAVVIAETDALGIITYANDNFCMLSGYNEKELLGSTYRIVKSNVHSSSFYRELWDTIQSGKIWRGEICNRHKNGTLYWVSAVIVPVMDAETIPPKPKKYITVRFDITDRKEV
jgi:PAS domain S-box-containing protein